jgi:hypothetical protein
MDLGCDWYKILVSTRFLAFACSQGKVAIAIGIQVRSHFLIRSLLPILLFLSFVLFYSSCMTYEAEERIASETENSSLSIATI